MCNSHHHFKMWWNSLCIIISSNHLLLKLLMHKFYLHLLKVVELPLHNSHHNVFWPWAERILWEDSVNLVWSKLRQPQIMECSAPVCGARLSSWLLALCLYFRENSLNCCLPTVAYLSACFNKRNCIHSLIWHNINSTVLRNTYAMILI